MLLDRVVPVIRHFIDDTAADRFEVPIGLGPSS